jgi:hypothetical protein
MALRRRTRQRIEPATSSTAAIAATYPFILNVEFLGELGEYVVYLVRD